MAESTLTVTFSDLQAEVGDFLGYGRGADFSQTTWTTRQQQDITECVKSGIRMFYFPSPLPGDSTSYDWSFMRPTFTVIFASGSNYVNLPDDFGGLEGEITITGTTGSYTQHIRQVNIQNIFTKRQQFPQTTGRPEDVAVSIGKGTTPNAGQRAKLEIWPIADQDYTLLMQYYFLPDALSATFPYAMGGATHSETIKAAVKAAAEIYKDNNRGVMFATFLERMGASVSLDRRNKAQYIGYNGDPSFNRGAGPNRSYFNPRLPITFGGQVP